MFLLWLIFLNIYIEFINIIYTWVNPLISGESKFLSGIYAKVRSFRIFELSSLF